MFWRLCMQCLLLVLAQLIKLLLLEGRGVLRAACVHTMGSSSEQSLSSQKAWKRSEPGQD